MRPGAGSAVASTLAAEQQQQGSRGGTNQAGVHTAAQLRSHQEPVTHAQHVLPAAGSGSPGDVATERHQQAGLRTMRSCIQRCAASCCLSECAGDLPVDQVASALALQDWGCTGRQVALQPERQSTSQSNDSRLMPARAHLQTRCRGCAPSWRRPTRLWSRWSQTCTSGRLLWLPGMQSSPTCRSAAVALGPTAVAVMCKHQAPHCSCDCAVWQHGTDTPCLQYWPPLSLSTT